MTVLVAGQDPAGAVAVAALLDGRAAVVGADGALTPLGERAERYDAAVYVLDACVPADAVDAVALGRLRSAYPTVLAATGTDVYAGAAATIAESARRCGAEVHDVQPDGGAGVEALRAALQRLAPVRAPVPAATPSPAANPALERADRSAYLRTTIARVRATLLASSADAFRGASAGGLPGLAGAAGGGSGAAGSDADDRGLLDARLRDVAAGLERSLHEHLCAAYRGTFAGWRVAPEPAAPALPRPEAPAAPARSRRPEDVAVLILGASAGLGIGRAVAAPLEALGALRWLALPISLAVGLAAALWLLRVRRRTTDRAAHRTWADAATAAFRQRVEFELAAALVAAESDAALRLARGPGTDRGAGASNGYGP
ncbi:hypothetical protein [Tsukamurella sp. PLM1]|uniref:hypothetical protein n=1 Tax=Tsukamurella sp. PLM1 TaxID=2929795 RepID=UPI00206227A2|nr:hypothetical protein [Tsukamurella sp. PLM1]BDH55327.1 hypothetical protein MTP03_02660 [Tsukamurella sp. PLM1]